LLQLIATGDETWVHHCEPASKRQSMEWKHNVISLDKEIQERALCQQSNVDTALGLYWAHT
jgi:hypothetical protein